MYGVFFIIAILVFFLSMSAQEKTLTQSTSSSWAINYAQRDAESFLTYRNAVLTYSKAHPAFRGEVPANQLGVTLPTPAIGGLSNAITSTASGNGVVIVCAGQLAPGALSVLEKISDNDASFGVVVGGANWQTAASGNGISTALNPLPSALPDGYSVSVVQYGV